MPASVVRIFSSIVLAAGCGSRTELWTDEPPVPDAAHRADGGIFVFPCRWTIGEPTIVLPAVSQRPLTAAVHGAIDEAAVIAVVDDGRTAIAVLSLAHPPAHFEVIPDALLMPAHSSVDGYATFDFPGALTIRDASFGPTAGLTLPGDVVSATQVTPRELTAIAGPEPASIFQIDLERLETSVTMAPLPLARWAVHTASAGHIVASSDGQIARVSDVGLAVRDTPGVVEELLPDRAHGGAVAILPREDGLSGASAVLVDDGLEMRQLATFDRFVGRPVTTDSELLVLLEAGVIQIQPLDGGPMRMLPLDEPLVAGQIAIRPGRSVGGVFYRPPGASAPLVLRQLVCGR